MSRFLALDLYLLAMLLDAAGNCLPMGVSCPTLRRRGTWGPPQNNKTKSRFSRSKVQSLHFEICRVLPEICLLFPHSGPHLTDCCRVVSYFC
jgi:hypothetical protein